MAEDGTSPLEPSRPPRRPPPRPPQTTKKTMATPRDIRTTRRQLREPTPPRGPDKVLLDGYCESEGQTLESRGGRHERDGRAACGAKGTNGGVGK